MVKGGWYVGKTSQQRVVVLVRGPVKDEIWLDSPRLVWTPARATSPCVQGVVTRRCGKRCSLGRMGGPPLETNSSESAGHACGDGSGAGGTGFSSSGAAGHIPSWCRRRIHLVGCRSHRCSHRRIQAQLAWVLQCRRQGSREFP